MVGGKSFKCEKCPYAATQKSDLHKHVQGVHEKVTPYQCDKCSYAASQISNLKQHMTAVHEKLRPFQCE